MLAKHHFFTGHGYEAPQHDQHHVEPHYAPSQPHPPVQDQYTPPLQEQYVPPQVQHQSQFVGHQHQQQQQQVRIKQLLFRPKKSVSQVRSTVWSITSASLCFNLNCNVTVFLLFWLFGPLLLKSLLWGTKISVGSRLPRTSPESGDRSAPAAEFPTAAISSQHSSARPVTVSRPAFPARAAHLQRPGSAFRHPRRLQPVVQLEARHQGRRNPVSAAHRCRRRAGFEPGQPVLERPEAARPVRHGRLDAAGQAECLKEGLEPMTKTNKTSIMCFLMRQTASLVRSCANKLFTNLSLPSNKRNCSSPYT